MFKLSSAKAGPIKNNEVTIQLAAKALVGLVAALQGMAIIFPLLGGLFALQFLTASLFLARSY